MPGELETSESQLPHEVADMERVSCGIESAIEREGPFGQALGERIKVGAVGIEAAPLQVFDQCHGEGK